MQVSLAVPMTNSAETDLLKSPTLVPCLVMLIGCRCGCRSQGVYRMLNDFATGIL